MTGTDLPALTVGWLGTGHMGAALAARIGRAGMDLTVWNRTRSKAEPLVDAGAKVADEPVELADRDLVFTMVSTSADLEQVVERLLTDPAKAPRILVDCSTVSAESSARVRAVCEQRGVAFLATPVSGNGKVVAAGKLSLVSSGPQEAYDEIEPVLNLLGRHVTYVGDGEKSRLVKICHNIMLGVVAQNLAEITVLAEKGGVPRAAMLDFLNNSVMGSLFTT
jgi:3-hydroxyisobutyrate dehydrogenase